eukprot:960202-Rhodomonas_salina.1
MTVGNQTHHVDDHAADTARDPIRTHPPRPKPRPPLASTPRSEHRSHTVLTRSPVADRADNVT